MTQPRMAMQAKMIAARARATLEDSVRERRPFSAVIFAWRGEQEVALVWPPYHQRDVILDVARKVSLAFSADLLAIVFDAWHSMEHKTAGGLNPLTGREWKSGDMQELAEHHHGIERGWVSEALNVHISNRAGDAALETLPYRREHGRRVVWLDPPSLQPDRLEGVIPDAMARIMSEPVIEQVMESLIPGMLGSASTEQAAHLRDFADLKGAELLGQAGAVVALTCEPGSRRAAYFAESGHEMTQPPWSDN